MLLEILTEINSYLETWELVKLRLIYDTFDAVGASLMFASLTVSPKEHNIMRLVIIGRHQ